MPEKKIEVRNIKFDEWEIEQHEELKCHCKYCGGTMKNHPLRNCERGYCEKCSYFRELKNKFIITAIDLENIKKIIDFCLVELQDVNEIVALVEMRERMHKLEQIKKD